MHTVSCCRQCICFYWRDESGITHCTSGCRHSMLLYQGKRSAPAEVIYAKESEHSPEGCVCQDGCRLCSRGCSRVPRAVVQSRSLLWPRGCVPGQGLCRLPGSALSCPGSCPGRCRETCGGKEPPGTAGQGRAGQGPSAATAAAWGRGITATLHPRVFPRALCERRDKAGIFHFVFVGVRKVLGVGI